MSVTAKTADASKAAGASTAGRLTSWEEALLGISFRKLPTLLPGLSVTAGLAWLSIVLSEFIGVQVMGFARSPISSGMTAILLGLLAGNLISLPAAASKSLKPGLAFTVKKVLRLGIILLGIRLSVFDVFKLGVQGLPVVLLAIIGALLFTTRVNAWLKLPKRLGTLIAVGTSICGVSAIVATAPAIDAEDEEVAYAVAVITVFGIIATLLYPYLANLLFAGHAARAGLFLGTAIHDTSQVTGASLVYAEVFDAPTALNVGTVAKLVRNVFMVGVIPLMAYRCRREAQSEAQCVAQKTDLRAQKPDLRALLPVFILGFLALAVVRSVGDAGLSAGASALGLWTASGWKALLDGVNTWALNFLVMALAGVGLSTRFGAFKGLGLKPFVVGLAAAVAVGAVSVVTITVLGLIVTF